MSHLMDRPLSLHDQFTMRFHMLICKWCRDYLYQLRFLGKLIKETRTTESDESIVEPHLQPEAKERLRRVLNEAGDLEGVHFSRNRYNSGDK